MWVLRATVTIRPRPAPELCAGLQCQELSLVTFICSHAFASPPCVILQVPPMNTATSMCYCSSSSWIIWNWPEMVTPEVILGEYKDRHFWRNTAWLCEEATVFADYYWGVGRSNPTQMQSWDTRGLSKASTSPPSQNARSDFSWFLIWGEHRCVRWTWDSIPAGLLVWPGANYLSQVFIFLLGGIINKSVKVPSMGPTDSNSVPPWDPVSGLREITPATE